MQSPFPVLHFHFVVAEQLSPPSEYGHPVTNIEIRTHLDLGINHFSGSGDQILPTDLPGIEDAAQQRIALGTNHLAYQVTKRLGRDRPPVCTVSTQRFLILDNGHTQAFLCRLHGRRFTRRPTANHHQIPTCTDIHSLLLSTTRLL